MKIGVYMTAVQIIVLCFAGLMLAYVLLYLLVLRRPPRSWKDRQPAAFVSAPVSRLDRTLTSMPARHTVQHQGGFSLASAQDIGARKSQQDSISCDLSAAKAVAVVCDGMGGMADGDKASKKAAAILFQRLWELRSGEDPESVMHAAAMEADREVYALGEAAGNPTGVGTTLVAVYAENRRVFWVSVGDSRIYLLRAGNLKCLTRDHIYLNELLELAEQGTITREEALSEPTREALTSYIGADSPEQIDTGSFDLSSGDILLLCSDGLYKSVPDTDIRDIILRMSGNLSDCSWMLVSEALRRGGNVQDNTSVVLLQCSESL